MRKSHLQNWYHIRVKLETEKVDFVFMMCDLTRIYDDTLNSVKYYDYGKYYTSRLKERNEDHFPQLILIKTENRYKLVKLISVTTQRK